MPDDSDPRGSTPAAHVHSSSTAGLSIATTYPMLPQRRLGQLPARPSDEPPGLRDRDQPTAARAQGVRFADHSLLEDVGVVVWATGYRSDYAWIHIPGVVREGHVVHRRGATEVPGLYFLGLSWQHTRGSALLGFVDDAYLADRIATGHRAAASATADVARQRSR